MPAGRPPDLPAAGNAACMPDPGHSALLRRPAWQRPTGARSAVTCGDLVADVTAYAAAEALRRLADRDPTKASTVFTRLLKPKRGFRWETDGEQLLRKHKPSYFDGTLLPRTVVLPEPLSSALRRARAESY